MNSAPITPSENSDASTAPTTATPSTSPPTGHVDTPSPTADLSTSPSTSTAASCSNHSSQPPPRPTLKELAPLTIEIRDPLNGRLELDQNSIAELATTLRAEGLLNPITVIKSETGYELVAGRRRLAAAVLLGWSEISCFVRPPNKDRTDYARLIENTARSQLSPVEEATQLANILQTEPGGVEAIAHRIGRRVQWVLDRLEMTDWPDSLLIAIHDHKISLSAGKQLVRIEPPALRETRIRDAVLHGISARTAALWFQDAVALAENRPPDVTPQLPGETIPYVSQTKALCFGCQEYKPLEETMATRMCQDCLKELSPPTQPARPTPPPPSGSESKMSENIARE